MGDSMDENCSHNMRQFNKLFDHNQFRQLFVLFLNTVKGKSFLEMDLDELVMLDKLCSEALWELFNGHTLWMVNHPGLLRRMIEILESAIKAEYRSANTLSQIVQLRCLLALHAAMTDQFDRIYEELHLADNRRLPENIPVPDRQFCREIQKLKLTEQSISVFLECFFKLYEKFLTRNGHDKLSKDIFEYINDFIILIAKKKNRPGVVRAMFYDANKREQGTSHFIVASLKEHFNSKDGSKICILHDVENSLLRAVKYAHAAANAYLKQIKLFDGLKRREIQIEIVTRYGDSVDLSKTYSGESIALPIAIAIISIYLSKYVASDIAFTGAISYKGAKRGNILPVDGICTKVKHAILSGSREIYVPDVNKKELLNDAELQELIVKCDITIVPVKTLEQACERLFPVEGNGKLKDIIKDVINNCIDVLHAHNSVMPEAAKPVHESYRPYILLHSVIVAAIIFTEGWMLYKCFAPSYPASHAWSRIIASSGIMFIGMYVNFTLPAAFLRHGKASSWITSIVVMLICCTIIGLLLAPMIPNVYIVSNKYNISPLVGMMKDLLIVWLLIGTVSTNTFNVVAAFKHLIRNRQIITARACLKNKFYRKARMPIYCVCLSWIQLVTVILILGGILLLLDLNYYNSLLPNLQTSRLSIFGMMRDMVMILVIIISILFYKISMDDIHAAII